MSYILVELLEFVQESTAIIVISTAKWYSEHYCIPVLDGKGAGETTGLWDLLTLYGNKQSLLDFCDLEL